MYLHRINVRRCLAADCPLLHLLEVLPYDGVLPRLLRSKFTILTAAVSKSFRVSPQFEKVAAYLYSVEIRHLLLRFLILFEGVEITLSGSKGFCR